MIFGHFSIYKQISEFIQILFYLINLINLHGIQFLVEQILWQFHHSVFD